MDLIKQEKDSRDRLREEAVEADPRISVFNADDIVWLLDLLDAKDSEIQGLYDDLAGEDL